MSGGRLLGQLTWTIFMDRREEWTANFFPLNFFNFVLSILLTYPYGSLKKITFFARLFWDSWYGPLCVDRVERRKYPYEDLAIFTNETECLQSGIRFLKS